MFRPLRRVRQTLSLSETEAILRAGTSGVLALSGDDGYPYAVPMSYVYDQDRLYFHCADAGHKLDAIRRCEKASFCVIGQDQVVPAEFTTYFRSAIAFGRIRVLEDPAEARAALTLLSDKYAPGDRAGLERELERFGAHLCLLELRVEHLSGKAAKELLPPSGTQA